MLRHKHSSICKSIKQTFLISHISYINWITSSRMLIIPITWIFFYEFSIGPMIDYSGMMSTPLNLFEPFITITNNSLVVPLVIISYMLLISDCPKIGCSDVYLLHRTGRLHWLVGQIIFFLYTAITYLLSLFIFSSLAVLSVSFIADGWSDFVRYIRSHHDFYTLYYSSPGAFIEENLFMHSRPYSAVARSLLLMTLYLMVISEIILLFNICKRKTIGIVISVSVVIFGFVSWASLSKAMWFFPMANSIYGWHNQSILSEQSYSIAYSYVYFAAILSVLSVISVIVMKRCSIHTSSNQS